MVGQPDEKELQRASTCTGSYDHLSNGIFVLTAVSFTRRPMSWACGVLTCSQ